MKKIFGIMFLISVVAFMGFYSNNVSAQVENKSNVVSVDLSTLPIDVQKTIMEQKETESITNKIATYGNWVGVGKEIGIATREGLTAIKDVTLDVAETNLGKTVIWVIVWKVVGKDVIRIFFAFIIFVFITFAVAKSYFRSFSNRRLESKTGFFLWPKKKYVDRDVAEDWGGDANRSAAQVIHAIVWLLTIGISFLVAFG